MSNQERALRADVRGTGTYYGDSIEVTLTNDIGQPVTVNVPVGFLLVPASTRVQTMVAAGGESLHAPPGKSAHRIKAFFGESHDDIPGIGTPFSAAGRASGALLERVNEVREAGRFDRAGQDRIWQVTDTMDLSRGAGGVTAWETRATVAAVLTALLLLGWQLLGDRINAPGVSPAPASDAAEGSSPEGSAATGGVEIEPQGSESHDDRPAWSLVHRQSYDDLFDERNERWVSRGSEEGRAILDARKREMADRGFDYDAERDAFIEQGLVYDEYSDSFRRPLYGPEPLDILPEEGDASRMYIGPGWVFAGDPGTSSDPEVVNKNLNARLDYLEALEEDIRSEHEALADRRVERLPAPRTSARRAHLGHRRGRGNQCRAAGIAEPVGLPDLRVTLATAHGVLAFGFAPVAPYTALFLPLLSRPASYTPQVTVPRIEPGGFKPRRARPEGAGCDEVPGISRSGVPGLSVSGQRQRAASGVRQRAFGQPRSTPANTLLSSSEQLGESSASASPASSSSLRSWPGANPHCHPCRSPQCREGC